MALGRQDNGNSSNSTLMFLSPRTKDAAGEKAKPYFSVRKKVDDSWKEVDSTDRFSGSLTKVESKEIPLKKGGKMELITLTVDDQETGERYVADFGFKVATRGLFNRLLNLESFENLEVSYWENDKGYDVLSLRQDGEPVKAKYVKDDPKVPLVQEVKLRGETVRDYILVDTFYKEELLKLNDVIKNGVKTEVEASPAKTVKKKVAKSETPDIVSDDDLSGIPF